MKLLAIDSNSVLNRAFYGVRPLTAKDGTPTNAIFGFFNIFLRLLDETTPDGVAFAFDLPAPTFRHVMYDGYKAQRKGMPPELAQQFPLVKELILALGYKIVETPGFEADDILGTLAQACEEQKTECVIATGDRDSLQLVSDSVTVLLALTKGGSPQSERYDPAAVTARYGVSPERLVDIKALMGDASDNIPGVAGIGEKTACALIAEHGSLDAVYASLERPSIRETLRAKLAAGRESAYLSRTLAQIARDAPVCTDISCYVKEAGDPGAAYRLLARLDMFKLADRLGLSSRDQAESAEPDAESPATTQFFRLSDRPDLAEEVKSAQELDILPRFDGGEITGAAYLLPGKILLSEAGDPQFRETLHAVLSGPCALRTDGVKQLYRYAIARGIAVCGVELDVGLAGYLLNPTSSTYAPVSLADSYGVTRSAAEVPDPDDPFFADCLCFSPLCDVLTQKIRENSQENLLREIEIPLAEVLASMELAGFAIDPDGLRQYGEELTGEIVELRDAIYSLAGCEFNINSPKQLGEILFGTLGLPAKKKTKSGYSTNAEVLDSLRNAHPIINLILRYRRLTKLTSTYVDGLLGAVGEDGRIHTTFIQTETRTGRISSVEPNMQNIPIRTEEGSRLRAFFRAGETLSLIDADYSQIELRVLAHISDDAKMKQAFVEEADIHTKTAAQVFGMPEDFVTPEMRRRAKAVNFGIVYGIGAYSLSEDIGVSIAEADRYIKGYLATYEGVARYMESVVSAAKESGYVTTLSGRRRALPELASSNRITRAFGERVAMNTPIQGSAADIIKIAMIRVFRRLREERLRSRLIMQVHDELIIEAYPGEEQSAAEILQYEMEHAAELSVPLVAEVQHGKTWLEAK